MNIEELQAMVDLNLKRNSRVPKSVRVKLSAVLYMAYEIGRTGDVDVSSTDDEAKMIQAFLDNNDVVLHEPRSNDSTSGDKMWRP